MDPTRGPSVISTHGGTPPGRPLLHWPLKPRPPLRSEGGLEPAARNRGRLSVAKAAVEVIFPVPQGHGIYGALAM